MPVTSGPRLSTSLDVCHLLTAAAPISGLRLGGLEIRIDLGVVSLFSWSDVSRELLLRTDSAGVKRDISWRKMFEVAVEFRVVLSCVVGGVSRRDCLRLPFGLPCR
jgi:hypothetical protein